MYNSKLYWSVLNLVSAVIGCFSIPAFASLVGIPIGITSSAIELKICSITAGIKNYKTTIKKKKHDKIALSAKTKLNSIEALISKSLINSYISHNDSVLVNNVLKE